MHIWHFEVPASPSHAVEMLSEPHTSICEKMEICGRGSENIRFIWEVDGKNFKEIWWKALKEIWVHAMNLRWKNWHVGGHEGGGWRPLWQLQPWLEISLAIRCLKAGNMRKKKLQKIMAFSRYIDCSSNTPSHISHLCWGYLTQEMVCHESHFMKRQCNELKFHGKLFKSRMGTWAV